MDLSKNLENTLSENKNIREKAEFYLKESQADANYPVYLLNLVETSSNNIVKLAAAITYKNVVKDTGMV